VGRSYVPAGRERCWWEGRLEACCSSCCCEFYYCSDLAGPSCPRPVGIASEVSTDPWSHAAWPRLFLVVVTCSQAVAFAGQFVRNKPISYLFRQADWYYGVVI